MSSKKSTHSSVLVLFFCLFLVLHAVRSEPATASGTSSGEIASIVEPWLPASSTNPVIQELHREYGNIFRHGNRNAASHLWSSFLFERSNQMTIERFQFFMSGYCAVSGSPVRSSEYTRYRLTLPFVGDVTKLVSGLMYYCCWPCVCDTQDFIRVDTKNVTTVDGTEQTRYFAVIGNPCDHPEVLTQSFVQPASYGERSTTLRETAPEVRCSNDGHLEGATLSDHGYVILSMFFDATMIDATPDTKVEHNDDEPTSTLVASSQSLPSWDGVPTPGRLSKDLSTSFHDEREWAPMCNDRAQNGYQSGMGEIFRRVSSISPIVIADNLPAESPTCQKNDGCKKEENPITLNDPKTVQTKN